MAVAASPHENGAQLRQPRLAEIVAGSLRERILAGDLPNGSLLPNQERLLEEFRVSKPSFREAMRILEAEGLITVQRGNVGGAQVHVPEAQHAAYTLGLVLQSRHVAIHDVGQALKQLEAACAGMCSSREDRHTEVVPVLRACNERARAALDDELAYVQAMADFHESVVGLCGNETMQLVAGALESLWLAHVRRWAERLTDNGEFPDADYRWHGLTDHEDLTDLIERGEVDVVIRQAWSHFDPTRFDDQPVRAAILRDSRFS